MINKISYTSIKPASQSLDMNKRIRKAIYLTGGSFVRTFALNNTETNVERFAIYAKLDSIVSKLAVAKSKEYYSNFEKVETEITILPGPNGQGLKDESDGMGLGPGTYNVKRYEDKDLVDFRHFIVDAAYEVLSNFENFKEQLVK